MYGRTGERMINCLWGCQHRYFGKNASAFVLKEDFFEDFDQKLIGCNKCHRQKWVDYELG